MGFLNISRAHDSQELVRLESGVADEAAILVRRTEQRRRILRLDAAAVLDGKRRRWFLAGNLRYALAQEDMGLLLLRRGVQRNPERSCVLATSGPLLINL